MKAIRRRLSAAKAAVQKGFTLIELAIVGLFLGLLAVFAISQFSGAATDNTRATAMFEATQKISDNWAMLAQSCGVSSNVTAIEVGTGAAPTVAGKNLSLLLGTAPPATAYTACYNASGIRPLAGMTTGAAGAERFEGSALVLTSVDSRNLGVTFQSVPANVFEAMFLKYAGSSTLPAPTASVAASSTNRFAYTAETAGARSVTFVRPL